MDTLDLFSDALPEDAATGSGEASPPEGNVESFAAWLERRRRLTDPAFVTECQEHSIGVIRDLVASGRTLRITLSGGKDSTTLTAVALEAVRREVAAGRPAKTVHVVSNDTGIENPEVSYLMHRAHAYIREYAQRHGFEVEITVTRPRLSEAWWARIIGGSKLPSAPGMKNDCTMDMKVSPSTRHQRDLDDALAARGELPSVTLIGTRFDESQVRAGNMRSRGESSDRIVEHDVGGRPLHILSPICDWPTETVWEFLRNAGDERKRPGFAPNFDALVALYDAASYGECVTVVDPALLGRRNAGCGARTGCMVCQKVSDDRSLRSMVITTPELGYLKPMLELGDYMRRTLFDYSHRRWVSHGVDPVTNCLKVIPNNYSPVFAQQLLGIVLTIDARERERASEFHAALESGRVADTEQNRRLARPQFQSIGARELVMIDWLWSLNAMAPPHEALRIAQAVASGARFEVPEVEPVQRRPPPTARYLPVDVIPKPWDALRDEIAESAYFEPQGFMTRVRGGEIIPITSADDDQTFLDIDEEAAVLFLEFLAVDAMNETAALGIEAAHVGVRTYLRVGTVSVPERQMRLLAERVERARVIGNLNLSTITPEDPRLAGALTESEHAALKVRLEGGQLQEHVPVPTIRAVAAPPASGEIQFSLL